MNDLHKNADKINDFVVGGFFRIMVSKPVVIILFVLAILNAVNVYNTEVREGYETMHYMLYGFSVIFFMSSILIASTIGMFRKK